MKKSIFILASIYLLLLSTSIFAQPEDPGDDPVPAAPIDNYVWVLALMGLFYVYLRFRAFAHQENTTENKK